MKIFENELIYVELHESEIPWLKIFTQKPYKELSECDEAAKRALFDTAFLIEEEMLSYFKPDKINWASFGNMLPRVHIHIQARFKNDSFFPEPMWGAKQREFTADFPPIKPFLELLAQKMQHRF
ncbi:MAG: HIT family protein [Campylobacteraceae bacterium]|jgi:diadenosine tetraphosphate (Ap4A) HIT family hydrolase|nr:HIT family protein [Campylobacteraceae bacterium]